MTEKNSSLVKTMVNDETVQQRFRQAYLQTRKMMQRIDLDLNRSQIIVVTDNGRQIYRPYRWDH